MSQLERPVSSQSEESSPPPKRDWRFWCIILSLSISSFMAALELGSMSTALPNIVHDLHGEQFIWVGSAYALAATAFMPLSGGVAQIFGRRSVMLGALTCFAVGSALCGAATSLNFLIAGRTVQGLGSGGIISITQIILADLVPLRERGSFNGLIAIWWSVGSGIGPIIGGSLAKGGEWRWLFYMNVPICGLAAFVVVLFLKLPTPQGTLREKLSKIDYIGNALIITFTTCVVLALTWGGIQYGWETAAILVPLIVGMLGIGGFIFYESTVPRTPMVPFVVMSNITGTSGYIQNFLTSFIVMAFNYFGPVYFQASKDASPIASGVDILGMCLSIAPTAFLGGIVIQKTNRYREPIWFGWLLTAVGVGMLTTVNAETSRGKAIGYQVIAGVGLGILYIGSYFPVLAPLPVSMNAQALGFYFFLRNFSLVWGVTLGGTIVQNELRHRLPADFISSFPEGVEIAYAVVPLIRDMSQPLKDEVRKAFAESLQVLWRVLTGAAVLGFLVSVPMKGLPLHTSVDRQWTMQQQGKASGEVSEENKSSA